MIAQRSYAKKIQASRAWIRGGHRIGNSRQICLRLFERSAWLQTTNHVKIQTDTTSSRSFFFRTDIGDPQLRGARSANRIRHVRRQDANHLIALAVEPDALPEDVGGTAKALAPECIADHGYALATVYFVVGCEQSADGRPDPENVEGLALAPRPAGYGRKKP